MRQILILYPSGTELLSGIPWLVRRLVGALRGRGADVTLILKKPSHAFESHRAATELAPGPDDRLCVQWWPENDFTATHRDQLLFRLERHHAARPIDHLVSIGVNDAGFPAAAFSRIHGIPLSVLISYADAYRWHLAYPYEFETTLSVAENHLAANPSIFSQLRAFHNFRDRERLIRVQPTEADLTVLPVTPNEETLGEEITKGRPYVVTTGHLGPLVDFADLLPRVQRQMHQHAGAAWVHAGTIEAQVFTGLYGRLTMLGLADSFRQTGPLARPLYIWLVRGAAVHIIPSGDRNTNIATMEARAWGVPLCAANGHLNSAAATAQEHDHDLATASGIMDLAEELVS